MFTNIIFFSLVLLPDGGQCPKHLAEQTIGRTDAKPTTEFAGTRSSANRANRTPTIDRETSRDPQSGEGSNGDDDGEEFFK